MIVLKQITPTAGDCTASYSVTLDKPYAVIEFINEVLNNTNEWGYIAIKQGLKYPQPECEYKDGKLLSVLPETFLKTVITNASAHGGYSRMDYVLTI